MTEKQIDDGGQAYPLIGEGGMTLRDYFAGQALIALPNIGCGADLSLEDVVLAAYQIADAMIQARK